MTEPGIFGVTQKLLKADMGGAGVGLGVGWGTECEEKIEVCAFFIPLIDVKSQK